MMLIDGYRCETPQDRRGATLSRERRSQTMTEAEIDALITQRILMYDRALIERGQIKKPDKSVATTHLVFGCTQSDDMPQCEAPTGRFLHYDGPLPGLPSDNG